jgi:hypothetical protein
MTNDQKAKNNFNRVADKCVTKVLAKIPPRIAPGPANKTTCQFASAYREPGSNGSARLLHQQSCQNTE